MEWISYPDNLPEQTGKYIVSVHRQMPLGIHVFETSAHYDADTNRWYRYDPFIDRYTPTEDITAMVAGWIDNLPAYFGRR